MSTPENPLSSFRTYSYYHILMICDNVQTATNASESSNINQFIKSSNSALISTNDIIEIDNKTGSANGKYIILVNSLSNAKYSIEELKWESITGQMGDNSGDNFVSMVTEGAMKIVEPLGILFLNEVKNAYELLECDPTLAVWMIKTIFVGFNHDSNSAPEYITNIKPLIFNVVDLTADFSIEGGTYNISFVNINNGSGKLPQLMNAAESIKITLDKSNTLQNAITKLNGEVNSRSLKHFNEVKSSVINSGKVPIPVKYEFILDDRYKNSEYIIDDTQQQNKTNGLTDDGCTLDFSKSISVENAIKSIMRHCSKVKSDIKGDSINNKYGYKIRSILNSTNEYHTITYHILKYRMVFSNIFADVNNTDAQTQEDIKNNTLELDYIYSGKNTDIIDFSMKMDMGLVFFQTIISNNSLGSQQEALSGNLTTTGQPTNAIPQDATIAPKKKRDIKMPIFLSTIMKNLDNTNSKNPKSSTEFQTLLNRQAALENLNSKIKIHGNPNLLNSINQIPLDYVEINRATPIDAKYAPVFPNWEKIPALAKINIFMPSPNANDISGREKFWYDGLFYVFGVLNEFSSGIFTQELDMISIPVEDNKENDLTFAKDKTTINSNILIEKDKPQKKEYSSVKTPEDTITFNEIKVMVIEIGNQYRVDPNLILAIIKRESSFKNNATESTRGTIGLMGVHPDKSATIGISSLELYSNKLNILAGTKLLKQHLDKYDDVEMSLAAYYDSEVNVDNAGGVPNLQNVKDYVKIVSNNYITYTNISEYEKEYGPLDDSAKVQPSENVEMESTSTATVSNLLESINSKTRNQ